MSDIYFEDDRHFSGTIFVKKNDGELIEGDEHDYGLLVCENDDLIWVFEPIMLLRNLTMRDLTVISDKLRELNGETKSMLHDDFINSTPLNSDVSLTEHVHVPAHVTAQTSSSDWGGSGGGGEAAGGGASGGWSSSTSNDSSSSCSSSYDSSSSDSGSCGSD